MYRSTHRADGQALVLVALALGILVALIVGVNEIALRRRTQTRVQNSLDLAAATAAEQLDSASLVGDAPVLLPRAATERFEARLETGLRRVASTIRMEPAQLARRAQITLVATGGTCHRRRVTAPAVCAELTVRLTGVFSTPNVTFTTLAQATRRP